MIKHILVIVILLYSTNSFAQDRHYWSNIGGISANLLGGSAISGLKDNSALYYNDAAMSFVENQSISLGANTYKLKVTNVENALGEGLDHFNTGFIINPDMIGGLMFSKKNDDYRFGYAIVSRFMARDKFFGQKISSLPSGATHVGDFDNYNRIAETWLKSANSFKVTDHFSYGVGLIVAIRTQLSSNYIGSKIIPQTNTEEVKRFDYNSIFKYWNVKAIIRLSTALDYENFRFGWTVTLPSINLFGSAYLKREISLLNHDAENAKSTSFVINGNDEKLFTTHKYPLSSAIGASFKLKNNNWLHFSSEVFFAIEKYEVFRSDEEYIIFPDDQNNIPVSENQFLSYSESAKFVANFSLGYESYITDEFGVMSGLRTDFNFSNPKDWNITDLNPYYSELDIYYLSGGIWGIINNKKITAGLEVGYSPKTKVFQYANFDGGVSPDNPLIGTPELSAMARQFTISLYLGIEINFYQKNKIPTY